MSEEKLCTAEELQRRGLKLKEDMEQLELDRAAFARHQRINYGVPTRKLAVILGCSESTVSKYVADLLGDHPRGKRLTGKITLAGPQIAGAQS